MIYYAIFADYGHFHGLFRSFAAAHRWEREMADAGYVKPTIVSVTPDFTEEEFLALGWGQRAGYWTLLNCLDCGYFGRRP